MIPWGERLCNKVVFQNNFPLQLTVHIVDNLTALITGTHNIMQNIGIVSTNAIHYIVH